MAEKEGQNKSSPENTSPPKLVRALSHGFENSFLKKVVWWKQNKPRHKSDNAMDVGAQAIQHASSGVTSRKGKAVMWHVRRANNVTTIVCSL